jgi:integrase/recombinase XerD
MANTIEVPVEGAAVNLDLEKLFAAFLREKKYLKGVTAATLRIYSLSWLAFQRHNGQLTKSGVKEFMVSMIENGAKPGTANCYARCLNSFLTWLAENGHTPERLRVPLTKQPKRVLKTYTPEEVERIIRHKPKSQTGKRIMAILFLLIDTGSRVSEALSLTRGNVDFENLLVTLEGKGGKQRRVPFGLECRKRLFQWLNTHERELVFCTKDGRMMRYDNLRRDFLALLRAAKVEKSEGSFHAFRRFFGKTYIRGGGNALLLQRIFGHSSLEMTRRYVDADEEDLKRAHRTLSPLESVIAKR